MSYRFVFQKRNLHLPYRFAVKNELDKIFRAATDVKNNSPEQKHADSYNSLNFPNCCSWWKLNNKVQCTLPAVMPISSLPLLPPSTHILYKHIFYPTWQFILHWWFLKVPATWSINMCGTTCPATQCHIQENLNLQQHSFENYKSCFHYYITLILIF